MRLILVDDEPAILEDLSEVLDNFEGIEVVGTYTEPTEVIPELSLTKPDCALLDIEMAGMSGIDLAEKLVSMNPNIEVIFVTAYNHYAAQAFEVNAIDYLLKPIRPERLRKSIEKIQTKRIETPKGCEKKFSIRCFGVFEVSVGNQLVKWTRSKSKELLAYLLQNEGKWILKYKLCDEQWAEYKPEQALAYLQTSIYALRKSLKEIGFEGISIEYTDDRYRLKVQNSHWDVSVFEQKYEEFKKTGSVEVGKMALDVYVGEYLEGEDWLWSEIQRRYYERKVAELKKRVNYFNDYRNDRE